MLQIHWTLTAYLITLTFLIGAAEEALSTVSPGVWSMGREWQKAEVTALYAAMCWESRIWFPYSAGSS